MFVSTLVFFLFGIGHAKTVEPIFQLREQARHELNQMYCAKCHTPNLKTSNSKALKIYNLQSANWTAAMSDRQLKALQQRLTLDLTPAELEEVGADPKKNNKLTTRQLKLFDDYLKNELNHRQKFPSERFADQQKENYADAFKALGL